MSPGECHTAHARPVERGHLCRSPSPGPRCLHLVAGLRLPCRHPDVVRETADHTPLMSSVIIKGPCCGNTFLECDHDAVATLVSRSRMETQRRLRANCEVQRVCETTEETFSDWKEDGFLQNLTVKCGTWVCKTNLARVGLKKCASQTSNHKTGQGPRR